MENSATHILWSIRSELGNPPWNIEELLKIVADHGFDQNQFCVDIQASPIEALRLFFQGLNEEMLKFTQQPLWKDLKTTAKIKHLLLERYRLFTQNQGLIKKIIVFLKKPTNWGQNLRIGYQTVNTMWYACGDTATDFNFYTKRALLGFVHGSTLKVWEKNPEDFAAIEQSLDQNLEKVLKIGKVKSKVKEQLNPALSAAQTMLKSVLGKFYK